MALLFSDKNISPGGQIYDRTTGTWAGVTKGNVGDGIDHGFAGYQSRVWHDANGPVGAQVYVPPTVGSGSAGVNPGNGGSGSASPQVTNGVPGKGGGGGAGAGSSLVVTAPDSAASIPKDKRLERIGVGAAQESLGAISDLGWVRTNSGWMSVPSSDGKERMEDDIFQEFAWQLRNKVLPDVTGIWGQFTGGWGSVPQPRPEFIGNPDALVYNSWLSQWEVKPGHVAIGGGF